MNYSEEIDNLLNGNEVCFNNDYVVFEFVIEANTWISTYIKVSVEYKYRESDEWKLHEISIPWYYKPTNKINTLIIPPSNTGTIYLKNLTSSGWFTSISLTGKNIELDNMTAQELLSQIESLRNEIEVLRNTISELPDMNNYVTNEELEANNYLTEHQDLSTYVSKIELNNCGYITISDIPSIDLSTYATVEYVDTKVSQIDVSELDVDLSNYVSKNELSNCSYITINDVPEVDLSTYATTQYVDNKVENIEITGGNYDDTEIKSDISSLNERLNKYIQGPSVELIQNTISYQEANINIASLFNVNDVFNYRFSKPFLETTYNPNIWSTTPYPTYNSNDSTYTFKENIDIVDFEYKITAYCDSENYQKEFTITQPCIDRIYFPQGNTLTLEDYTSKFINLTQYIITNYSDFTIDNDSFVVMNNLSGITFNSNSNSKDSRTVTITIHNEYTFTITQPGNPDYQEGQEPIDEPTLEEFEYEMTLNTFADNKIEENDILIEFSKGSGSSAPVYNASSSQLRTYAKNTIVISSTYTITKIEFTRSSHSTNAILTSTTPTLNEIDSSGIQIWEGNSNEVDFLLSDSGQYRITSLKVTLLK